VRYEMNLHVRGVVHGECNTSLSKWMISRTLRLKMCLKLFLSVKSFVPHLVLYSKCLRADAAWCFSRFSWATQRDYSVLPSNRLWPVPVWSLRVHPWLCAEASCCSFHLAPAISQQMRERPVLPSARIAPTVLPQSVNRSMHRPAHRVTAWQKRDWGRVLKLAHKKSRLGVREVCIHCVHCQRQTLHTVSRVWGQCCQMAHWFVSFSV